MILVRKRDDNLDGDEGNKTLDTNTCVNGPVFIKCQVTPTG